MHVSVSELLCEGLLSLCELRVEADLSDPQQVSAARDGLQDVLVGLRADSHGLCSGRVVAFHDRSERGRFGFFGISLRFADCVSYGYGR